MREELVERKHIEANSKRHLTYHELVPGDFVEVEGWSIGPAKIIRIESVHKTYVKDKGGTKYNFYDVFGVLLTEKNLDKFDFVKAGEHKDNDVIYIRDLIQIAPMAENCPGVVSVWTGPNQGKTTSAIFLHDCQHFYWEHFGRDLEITLYQE